MRVAIHQPNYLPWAGYFTKMLAADVFILLDTAQFSKNGYLNRVAIKTPAGAHWLTQPVRLDHHLGGASTEIIFADASWTARHARTLRANYARAPHFSRYVDEVEALLVDAPASLVECNDRLIRWLAGRLGIERPILRASTLDGGDLAQTDRLIALVRAAGGDTYVSGAGGFGYQDEEAFAAAGIDVVRAPGFTQTYPQPWGEFEAGLSALDLLFNTGDAATELLQAQLRATHV